MPLVPHTPTERKETIGNKNAISIEGPLPTS